MKYKLKANQTIQCVGISLLAAIFIFSSLGAVSSFSTQKGSVSQTAIANYIAAQRDPNLSDEDRIKTTINAYFTTHYEGQKLLKEQDFSQILEDNTLDWVKKEKDKREIELYIASLFNLKYKEYAFTLAYDWIEIGKDDAIVQLHESHQVVFDALAPDISQMDGLKHVFTLHNINGAWAIYKDEYQDEYSQLLNYESKSEIEKQIDKTYQENIRDKSVNIIPRVLAGLFFQPLALTNYSYNRTAARNYADVYWSTTSPPYYIGLAEDCANFVSQALYAGEGKAPPDTSGMNTSGSYTYDWYYIWNNSGSLPWIRVQDQYVRITINSSGRIGPYGTGSTNRCLVRLGDVVQLFNADGTGTWDHEGIIVETPYPKSCDISLYKVDAHTINRYHYSLSYWSGFQMRYILISGWRGN